MTFLPTQVAGRWFYLYLILDVYSRKIVGFEVHEDDDCDHAARLVQRTALAEGIHAMPRAERPVLHGDNGATLKVTTVLAMLWWLGVKPSYSRPRVSDDNACASRCSARPSTGRSSRLKASRTCAPRATGRCTSCIGTTTSSQRR